MAPTRELAQQIEDECIKLAKYTSYITANIVGGQSIEEQGFKLRKGVHIGTIDLRCIVCKLFYCIYYITHIHCIYTVTHIIIYVIYHSILLLI